MKKLIASVLAIVLIFSVGSMAVFAESFRIGDVNRDGNRDSADLVLLRQQLLAVCAETEMSFVNDDEVLDIRDLIRLKQYLVKVTDAPEIPVGELEIDGK